MRFPRLALHTRSCRGNFNYFSSHQSQSGVGKSSSTQYTLCSPKNWRATRAARAALAQFVVNWIYSSSWPRPLAPFAPCAPTNDCPATLAIEFSISYRIWHVVTRRQSAESVVRPFSVSCSVSLSGHEGHLKLLKLFCHFVGLPSHLILLLLRVLECPLCRRYRCTRLWLSHWNFLILSDSKYLWILVIDFQTARQVPMCLPALTPPPPPAPPSANRQAASASAFAQCANLCGFWAFN